MLPSQDSLCNVMPRLGAICYDLEFENQDYSPARSMRMGGVLSALPEKCVFDSWDTDRLLDMLEKGKLTGNLKKVAEKMTVDDNPLLILYKFK